MEPIKLTEEEINTIRELQQKNNAVAVELGNVELSKLQIERRRAEIITFLEDLRKEEQTFGKEMNDKYGDGTIDLGSGEFVPTPAPIEG